MNTEWLLVVDSTCPIFVYKMNRITRQSHLLGVFSREDLCDSKEKKSKCMVGMNLYTMRKQNKDEYEERQKKFMEWFKIEKCYCNGTKCTCIKWCAWDFIRSSVQCKEYIDGEWQRLRNKWYKLTGDHRDLCLWTPVP